MNSNHQIDLFGMDQTASPEELLELRKRELRNLLTSYADEADVFCETIQNAFDAVTTARTRGLYQSSPPPRLDIVIGRRADDPHYLLVCDNGVGMSKTVASRFTMPGFTHAKGLGRTIGYKGVGASFFFAAANTVAFQTEDPDGHQTAATVTGSFRWIMSSTESPPTTSPHFHPPPNAKNLLPQGRGTAVYYEFHPGLKPKSLAFIVNRGNNPSQELCHWASYLCTKTALGQAGQAPDESLQVGLHLDLGEDGLHSTSWHLGSFSRDDLRLGYPYPWRVFAVHKDLAEIDATAPPQRLVKHKGKHQALRLRWDKEDILALPQLRLTEDEEELATEHLDFLDVFLAYSTDVLDEVHKRTGARSKTLRYGIRMACDGIPQGRVMDFDLTSHQGLARQAHALVSFKGLELDTGRKIPANAIVAEVVRKMTVRAMSHLVDYRWALKKKARPDPSPDLDGWRNSIRERMSRSLVREFFETSGTSAPIRVDPDTEQDVIALFSVLLASNSLKGYELVALSGFNQYDGLVNIRSEDDYLRDHTDLFSVRNGETPRDGDYRVLEFKLQFESLLDDFENRTKRPQDRDLLVCWTLPEMNVRRGSLRYTYGDRKDFRETYGMTHLWADEEETSAIPILCLKHFVSEKLRSLENDVGKPGIGTVTFNDLLETERAASI